MVLGLTKKYEMLQRNLGMVDNWSEYDLCMAIRLSNRGVRGSVGLWLCCLYAKEWNVDLKELACQLLTSEEQHFDITDKQKNKIMEVVSTIPKLKLTKHDKNVFINGETWYETPNLY
jgi:hypothetical protein